MSSMGAAGRLAGLPEVGNVCFGSVGLPLPLASARRAGPFGACVFARRLVGSCLTTAEPEITATETGALGLSSCTGRAQIAALLVF